LLFYDRFIISKKQLSFYKNTEGPPQFQTFNLTLLKFKKGKMVALKVFEKRHRLRKVPPSLVWEVINGKPYYRKGYKEVLRKLKTVDEIMGTSSWQSLLCDHITRLLHRHLDENKYDVMINELGLHIEKGDNVSTDISIVPRLSSEQINKKYINFAPKIVIEVDLDIDTEDVNELEYLHNKTQKLLDFGVEKVIWVLTFSQKVIVATQEEDWLTSNWNRNIEIIDGIQFNIQNYLDERGVRIDSIL
jgi:Putative restriction endonuclease